MYADSYPLVFVIVVSPSYLDNHILYNETFIRLLKPILL